MATQDRTHPQRQRRYERRLKFDVVKHYSNGTMACANSFGEHKEPYITFEALTVDHVRGGGHTQRQELGLSGFGFKFYLWLIKHDYPEGYQILCMNCQFIKRHRNKEMQRTLI